MGLFTTRQLLGYTEQKVKFRALFLELFFRHPRQVFSSERLMERIWGLDSEAGIDVVWTYIGFLRKKLRQVGAELEIKTIRGAGYALEETGC